MRLRYSAFILAPMLAIAACQSPGVGGAPAAPDGRTVGYVFGALAGGLAGAQIGEGEGRMAAIVAGALLGAWVGGELGERLTAADRQAQAVATRSALAQGNDGQAASWSNPQTGARGAVTPERTFTDARGRTCREFESAVSVGDDTQTAKGVACQDANGNWRMV